MKKRNISFAVLGIVGAVVGLVKWPERPAQSLSEHLDSTMPKLPSVAQSLPQRQSPVPVGASTRPPKSFAALSVLERNQIIDEIRNQELISLFNTWRESGRSDVTKQDIVGFVFAQALREKPADPRVFEQMHRFVSDPSNSGIDRSRLLDVLGEAKTKESLELLLQLALTLPDKEFQRIACRSIRAAGGMWENGTFHEELSPALERIWLESQDKDLLASVALAIAKVGAPNGVEKLLVAALASESPEDFRGEIARTVLSSVLNSNAVPVLFERLGVGSDGSAASKLASSTLVAIGDEFAAKHLLKWLQIADESAAPLAHDCVIQTRTPAMLEAWEAALNPTVPFRTERNRAALRAGLVERGRIRQ
jgi:HEAT repeat protein